MSFLLSPVGNELNVDSMGDPLSGGLIETLVENSSTNTPTYTGLDGETPRTNPVELSVLGLVRGLIWLEEGRRYKFVVKNSSGIIQQTVDNVEGITRSVASQSQWVIHPSSPTFISATSFSVTGDNTSIFHVGRRVRALNTSATIYSTITASSFGAGVTTVTVVNDSGALDSGLSQVSYGLVSFEGTSFDPIIKGSVKSWFQAAAPLGWTQVVTQNNKALRVVSGAGGGIGGSVAFTTAFASQAITGSNSATTVTTAQLPAHTHNFDIFRPSAVSGSLVESNANPGPGATGTTDGGTGGGGSHNHTFTGGTAINLAVQYIDMLIATKD